MSRLRKAAQRFLHNDGGAALAEYAILIAFIAIVCIVAVTFFGTAISAKFQSLGNSFT